MVNKITTPPTTSELIGKVNELVDDKQDTLVSGTNIKTINNESLLGSGNITIQGGGSSYTAGTGIDITNDVISVTSDISTGAALGATAVQPNDDISELTNNVGYITGITSSDVTTALGYTPYNSSNPNRYITSFALTPYALSSSLATVATSGSYNDLSNKPTIPTVNNATLTIQKNGTNVATFTANASSNVTANISVPNTTSSVTSGSTAALTSGGAYTNLVRRKSTSAATGSASQGVYVDANGQVQTCTAVTSTYAATGTAPVNGVAVSNAIATKQDNLVSGTNIKTINGTSLLGSGDIVIQSEPNLDNKSITKNTANELQTVGVINQNNASQAVKTWTGTLAEYNAIVTKDSNTLYNITDDNTAVAYQAYTKSEVDSLIEAIYPVGSIYIGTQSTCPLATLISGSTWVKVSEGRVLQGSDSGHNANTTIEAGLPNHTHHIAVQDASGNNGGGGYIPAYSSDASSVIVNTGSNGSGMTGTWTDRKLTGYNYSSQQMTNASDENSIYGNSTTVQPPAYVVNIWKRTA